MLSKVNNNNIYLGTDEIIKYNSSIKDILTIQDNLNNSLLIKTKKKIYLYNYINKKIYNHNRIQIYFNNSIILKQIDSFDQNNIFIANKIRKYVLSLCKDKYDEILGIGGEYYIYFPFIIAKKYFGISNHKSIIEDAQYNILYSNNYLIDYNLIKSYPKINKADMIIINVYNLHNNIIEYVKNINYKHIIIIACNLSDTKLKLLVKNFKIKNIQYFKNINNFIKVIYI